MNFKKNPIKIFNPFVWIFLVVMTNIAFAGQTGAGRSLTGELSGLKENVTQWGTSAAGIAIFISGSLAVSSLILPWRFLKDTLGRPAWIGLISAIFIFIILSFFGNSIHAAIVQIVQCPLQIIGFPCN